MKTLVVAVAILGSSLFNNTHAEGKVNMKDKIKKAVKFERNKLAVEKNKPAFVRVSFKIDKNGNVEILHANYSDEKIQKQLMKKLAKIKVEENHNTEKVYNYKFTFKKL